MPQPDEKTQKTLQRIEKKVGHFAIRASLEGFFEDGHHLMTIFIEPGKS